MGSKTVDEAGIETGTEAKRDKEAVDVIKETAKATEATKATKATETTETTETTEETSGEIPADEREASDEAADEAADEVADEVADQAAGAAGGKDPSETSDISETSDTSAGVGQGAAALVSAGLGLVSLTGSWLGTIAQDRNSVYGQLEAATSTSVSTQIRQVYVDSWNANALVAALFALVALIVGVAVLLRPAFGDPDRVRAPWIKSVAWAGIWLGFLGLVLAALKYSDVLLAMPTTG